VFPRHTRANECCQLAGHAASRVAPGTLQDHRDSPRPRRLLCVCDPAGRSGRGATFAAKSRIGDVWSATLPQSDKGRVARHSPIICEKPKPVRRTEALKNCAATKIALWSWLYSRPTRQFEMLHRFRLFRPLAIQKQVNAGKHNFRKFDPRHVSGTIDRN